MKTLVLWLLVGACFGQTMEQQFPENPQPVKHSRYGGYEIDKSKIVKDPPVFTKKWVGAHAFYLGATVFDIEITHQGLAHHNCVEQNLSVGRHPSRGDLYKDGMLPFAVLTGMDLLFQSLHPPKWAKWMPYMGAGYGSAVHLRGGIRWATQCW